MKFIGRNMVAGLFFVALGLAVSAGSSSLRMGQLSAMGPGYFPFWLGLILAGFGAMVIIGTIAGGADEPLTRWNLRGLALITASIVLFGILLEPMGIAVSIFVLVLVSGLADREFSLRSSLANATTLAALTIALFHYGLGIKLPIWPSFLAG